MAVVLCLVPSWVLTDGHCLSPAISKLPQVQVDWRKSDLAFFFVNWALPNALFILFALICVKGRTNAANAQTTLEMPTKIF